MLFKDIPIRRKLITVIMLTSGAVLLLTCAAFFAYEFHSFRKSTIQQLTTLGEIIAANSTAALAFESQEDAEEILSALKAEKNIVAACLYDKDGNIFSYYPSTLKTKDFPLKTRAEGYDFGTSYLEGFQPVVQGTRPMGTLYLKSDLGIMYERFKSYSLIAIIVIAVSTLFAFLLSKILQKGISKPIMALGETAKAISERHDYSVRAAKLGKDELGSLTDAFNHMLTQIQEQNQVLNDFNQNLEQKVKARTIELEALNKELGSFSYSISHDLRAPLRSIHGYVNIFAEEYGGSMDDEAKRLMNIISQNAQKMGQLIDDLLAFSQLGRKELQKSNVSMNHIVTSVWEELIKQEGNREIELILTDLPSAHADSVTIRQVWVNLISNALKYSRKKEKAVIEISWDKKDGQIRYFVRDNGAGFDMQYNNKLFGVFQRLHSQKEFEGTGVGLAIVERVITKHGGQITANAKLNEGATFYFSLGNNSN